MLAHSGCGCFLAADGPLSGARASQQVLHYHPRRVEASGRHGGAGGDGPEGRHDRPNGTREGWARTAPAALPAPQPARADAIPLIDLRPLGAPVAFEPPADAPPQQRFMGHNELIVYEEARHKIKYVLQVRAGPRGP